MTVDSTDNRIGQIKNDKLLIRFKPGVFVRSEDIGFIRQFGNIIHNIPTLNSITLKLYDRSKIEDAIYNIKGLYSVWDIKRNVIIAHATTIEEPVPRGIQTIRAPVVHSQGNQGDGIKVCVSDTGVYKNHPDLQNNYVAGYNAITNTTGTVDDFGHGTHVAGTIAANGSIIGVAPKAKIYDAKVLDDTGSGGLVDIIEGLQWAIDQGVQVVNMSWGGPDSDKNADLKSLMQNNPNILWIASAGNGNKDGSDTAPGSWDVVLSVAALDSNYTRAYFSNYGPTVDVAAPGTMTYSTSTNVSEACLYDSSGYVYLGGTSMSCPHVVGVAALLIKAHPEYSTSQLTTALKNGCIPLSDTTIGKGLIDAPSIVQNTTPPPLPGLPGYYYGCANPGTDQGMCDKIAGSGSDKCAHHYSCRSAHFKCIEVPPFGKMCIKCANGPLSMEDCNFECEHKGYICETKDVIGKYCSYVFGHPGDPLPEYKTRAECKAACTGEGETCPNPKIQFGLN